MIIQNAFISGQNLISTILVKMPCIGKVQRKFILHILILILAIRGRVNFLQLARYGYLSEKSYRNNFSKSFDWFTFNKILIDDHCSDELIIGFDPSFISKSGKHTPGLGYFYSGCNSKYMKGLEIGAYSVIDVKQNTAYHLYAEQTPVLSSDQENLTLMDLYINQLKELANPIKSITNILVCDAYFSKYKYVHEAVNQELEFISRLRKDANLRYLYNGSKKTGKGRPKLYDGKVNVKKIDKRRAKKIHSDQKMNIYSIVVNSVNLKMDINLVWVEMKEGQGKIGHIKMYFSTNLHRDGLQVLKYYQARYQMEFNFRDGKQFTGLQNGQSRCLEKMKFHFNASLTAVNIAKVLNREGVENNQPKTLSVHSIKTEISNALMLNSFISMFGIKPDLKENKERIRTLLKIGRIAA